MITEKDSAPTCSKLISTKWVYIYNSTIYIYTYLLNFRDFWKFLKIFGTFIDNLIQKIRFSTEEQKQLKTLKKSDLTICILTIDKEVPFAMDLLYIIEGVIPLLSGLCHELSHHLYARTIPDMTPESIEVTRMLGNKLKVFIHQSHCV